jgi:hypothetical protein
MTLTKVGLAANPLLILVLSIVGAQVQISQNETARQLLSEDVAARNAALEKARTIGVANMDSGLRAALITLLDRQNDIVVDTARRGEFLADVEDPEFISQLSRLVAELHDPRAIPALSVAIYGGLAAMRGLAAFGEPAVQTVVGVVMSQDMHHDFVDHGLKTLRFMVEGNQEHPLSADALEQIRRATEQRLTGKQNLMTLWYAIDLAAVLGDTDHRIIIQSLATDANAVAALGISDPDLIEKTQERAAERLAGIPALPRP